MKPIKKIFILCFVFLFTHLLLSQDSSHLSEISSQEQIKLKNLATENIKNLGFLLKELAEVEDDVIKEKFIEAILEKFIDNAKIQTGVDKKGKVKITSPNGGYTVNRYLREIIPKYKSTLFSFVQIEMVSFDIGDLKPLPGVRGTYFFEYSYVQRFKKGVRNSNANRDTNINYTYIDETKKSGRIVFSKKNTILGTKWVLLFDSIIVDDVKKIS